MANVQLFTTCLVDPFHPQRGKAIVDILHHISVDVKFPIDQTCCGQPSLNAGLCADA